MRPSQVARILHPPVRSLMRARRAQQSGVSAMRSGTRLAAITKESGPPAMKVLPADFHPLHRHVDREPRARATPVQGKWRYAFPARVESRAGAPTLGSGGDSGACAPTASIRLPSPRCKRLLSEPGVPISGTRARQWDHAPRTRSAGATRACRRGRFPDIICGRCTAPAVHSRHVSSEPSSLFTPRRHRTCTVRLLRLRM